MKPMNGIVAAVFRETPGKKEFLILHRVLNWSGWEMPKGSAEEGESLEEALRRELFEETGLKEILEIKKLNYIMGFFDRIRKCRREMQVFLVKVNADEKVSLENNKVREHDAFEWASAETALKKLTFSDQKDVLKAALKEIGR